MVLEMLLATAIAHDKLGLDMRATRDGTNEPTVRLWAREGGVKFTLAELSESQLNAMITEAKQGLKPTVPEPVTRVPVDPQVTTYQRPRPHLTVVQ